MNKLSITPDRDVIKHNFTDEEIAEIANGLVNGSIIPSDVPEYIHPRLYIPLSIAKNEARIGKLVDKYNHINDVMWSLKFSLVKPDKSLMPKMGDNSMKTRSINTSFYGNEETKTITLMTALNGNDNDQATKQRRIQGELDMTRAFWDNEEERLRERKEKELKEMQKRHRETVIPRDENEAKRVKDGFELEYAEFRSKWQSRMREFEQNKKMELRSIIEENNEHFPDYPESPVSLMSTERYDSPQQSTPASSPKMNQTTKPKKSPRNLTQTTSNVSPKNPKTFAQTAQPSKSPAINNKARTGRF